MANYEVVGCDLGTLSASGDMNSNQYKFMQLAGTAGRFELATGASGPAPFAVLQDDPDTGNPGRNRLISGGGVTLLKVHASPCTIAYGDFLTCASDGYGETSNTAGSNPIYARALEAVSSGSAIISVILENGQIAADNV